MNLLEKIDALSLRLMTPFIKSEKRRIALLQFINFAFIGVINTFIDFGIYTLLTRYTTFFHYSEESSAFPWRIILASILSFLVATTFSFFSNRTWTFKQKEKPTLGEAAKFYSTTSSGIVISSGLLYVLVHAFGMFDLYAKIFSTIVTIFWNFILKRFWVFTPAPETSVAVK